MAAELSAQVTHVDVDPVGLRIEVDPPYHGQQLLARKNLVGVAYEGFQERELTIRQVHLPTIGPYLAAHHIDADPTGRPDGRRVLGSPPEPGSDPGQELVEGDGRLLLKRADVLDLPLRTSSAVSGVRRRCG